VLTLQGYRTLTTYGATDALSTLLGLSLYRELAPVLTALLFIGRAGSSIAAELGLMRATDQIKALELMAIDPVAKAVAPRFWAAVLTVPLLTGVLLSLAISAGWFQAVQVLGIDNGTLLVRPEGQRRFLGRLRRGVAEVGGVRRHRRAGRGLRRLPRRADHRGHLGGDHPRGGQRLAAGADVQLRPFRPAVPLRVDLHPWPSADPDSNSPSAPSCCWRWPRCWCWRWPRPTASSASAAAAIR
jgi:hypothetical protein